MKSTEEPAVVRSVYRYADQVAPASCRTPDDIQTIRAIGSYAFGGGHDARWNGLGPGQNSRCPAAEQSNRKTHKQPRRRRSLALRRRRANHRNEDDDQFES